MKKLIISLLFFLTLNACQPIEKTNHIVFDNSQFAHFNILSTSIEINEIFEKKISDPYIGHTLEVNPSDRIINWINDNFKPIGNENFFNVTILDASISQKQFVNEQAKDLAELNQKKEALEQSLAQSDSLQRTYKRVLEQQMESKSTSETSITFEGNNDKNKTREFDLYKNDIELRREIVQIERKLKDKQNIVEIISGKQDSGFVDDTQELLGLILGIKRYYLVLFTILAFVILFGIEFLKFLEKYKPE